ncbi:MAG TPA: gluconokinase [Ktedonobacteraceae bacterium]|jgi:gluconokinase|nr:gluconokinase [Ktedonobacteraceae bacterium]
MSQFAPAPELPQHASQPPYILALDIGTSSVRALLFDATGTALPQVISQIPYDLTTSSDGESSVDADMLVELVAKTIDEALTKAGPLASRIGAIATDTFWHSLLGIDKDGKPLIPVLIWEDTRSRKALAELSKQLDSQELLKRNGARLHTSYWPAKLRWLANTQPEIMQKTAQWLSFGEYMQRCFLGKSVCSLSMASGTGLLNIRARAWDTQLLPVLNIRPDQLPPLGDIHDRVQGLKPEYASRWPALRDIPWYPAIGDGAAANVGSGCVTEKNWAITIGTSSAIRVVVSPDEVVPAAGLWLYLLDAKCGLIGGALSEGGNVVAWLEHTLKLPPLKEVEPQIANMQPDSSGLTILPFISGERSPGWHDEARLTITGLNSHTTPLDILRASLEAIAYQLNIVYDQLNTQLEKLEIAPTLIGSGGALLSSPTLQGIIADTLNTPLYPSIERECSARGVALLALEALGTIPDVADVPVELEDPLLPEETRHGIYVQAAQRQQELYDVLLNTKRVN